MIILHTNRGENITFHLQMLISNQKNYEYNSITEFNQESEHKLNIQKNLVIMNFTLTNFSVNIIWIREIKSYYKCINFNEFQI